MQQSHTQQLVPFIESYSRRGIFLKLTAQATSSVGGTIFKAQVSNLRYLKVHNITSEIVVFWYSAPGSKQFPPRSSRDGLERVEMPKDRPRRARAYPPPFALSSRRPSNLVWCRRGMEEVVLRERRSVPRIENATACREFAGTPPARDMRYCVHGQWVRIADLFRTLREIWPQMEYAVQTKHEGSFYAYEDVMAVLDGLERHERLAQDIYTAAIYVEEFVFQSWVANFAPHGSSFGHGTLMMPTKTHRLQDPNGVRQSFAIERDARLQADWIDGVCSRPRSGSGSKHNEYQGGVDLRWNGTGFGLK